VRIRFGPIVPDLDTRQLTEEDREILGRRAARRPAIRARRGTPDATAGACRSRSVRDPAAQAHRPAGMGSFFSDLRRYGRRREVWWT